MPAVLTNLFYVDDVINIVFVRVPQRLGVFFGRIFDPHIVDGAVRELVDIARGLGDLVRVVQTGLLRFYALVLVFGAFCFIAYYALAGAAK